MREGEIDILNFDLTIKLTLFVVFLLQEDWKPFIFVCVVNKIFIFYSYIGFPLLFKFICYLPHPLAFWGRNIGNKECNKTKEGCKAI